MVRGCLTTRKGLLLVKNENDIMEFPDYTPLHTVFRNCMGKYSVKFLHGVWLFSNRIWYLKKKKLITLLIYQRETCISGPISHVDYYQYIFKIICYQLSFLIQVPWDLIVNDDTWKTKVKSLQKYCGWSYKIDNQSPSISGITIQGWITRDVGGGYNPPFL